MQQILKSGVQTAGKFSDIRGFKYAKKLDFAEGKTLQNAPKDVLAQNAQVIDLMNQATALKNKLVAGGKKVEGDLTIEVSFNKKAEFWLNVIQWTEKKLTPDEQAAALLAMPD